ncbi:hypothetical protein ELAC_1854 [Estrella lausannensis]|uniref:Uncharacterized protein n=1 Tax=Estrella lausannensis TaxID=483423 RepID=A0A0H5DTJ6_9BACT|nr:hypothetical protein ELAC_1854 [Estrella lausannensis]
MLKFFFGRLKPYGADSSCDFSFKAGSKSLLTDSDFGDRYYLFLILLPGRRRKLTVVREMKSETGSPKFRKREKPHP